MHSARMRTEKSGRNRALERQFLVGRFTEPQRPLNLSVVNRFLGGTREGPQEIWGLGGGVLSLSKKASMSKRGGIATGRARRDLNFFQETKGTLMEIIPVAARVHRRIPSAEIPCK